MESRSAVVTVNTSSTATASNRHHPGLSCANNNPLGASPGVSGAGGGGIGGGVTQVVGLHLNGPANCLDVVASGVDGLDHQLLVATHQPSAATANATTALLLNAVTVTNNSHNNTSSNLSNHHLMQLTGDHQILTPTTTITTVKIEPSALGPQSGPAVPVQLHPAGNNPLQQQQQQAAMTNKRNRMEV